MTSGAAPVAVKRVLVLFAHPAPHKSRVNVRLAAAVMALPGVTFRDLYETYPDFLIDVEAEQKLLLEHDVIVFQHPFYWYSTPAILKEWFDLVLEYGFAYGEGGTKLAGKIWLSALTAGGGESSYAAGGHNAYSVRQLLAPVEQTANLCGMRFVEPFVIYASLEIERRQKMESCVSAYRARVEALRDGRDAESRA